MVDQTKELLPLISGLVALTVALVKLTEVVLSFLMKKISKTRSEVEMISEVLSFLSDKNSSTLAENERDMLKDLHKILSRCDENGLPLCYYPREMNEAIIEAQKEIIQILNKFSSYQEKTVILLEYAIEKINEIENTRHRHDS